MHRKIYKMFPVIPKRLAAFDFDYTIVDDNTDTVVRGLLPDSDIVSFSETHWQCWTYYMQDIFHKLHKRNITDLDIYNAIVNIQPVHGMKSLIKTLKDDLNFDIIIISDSNTVFIDKWLSSVGLKDCIFKVFSNPAQFVNQLLKIQPYHEQNECKLSPINMCKYRILDEFLKAQKANNVTYRQVYFFGDGANDFCPISRLSMNDVGCVRYGFKCFELLQKCVLNEPINNVTENHIRAEIFIWHDGHELVKFMRDKVK